VGSELGLEAEKPLLVAGFHELVHKARRVLNPTAIPR
jgi:hypothetical protein